MTDTRLLFRAWLVWMDRTDKVIRLDGSIKRKIEHNILICYNLTIVLYPRQYLFRVC